MFTILNINISSFLFFFLQDLTCLFEIYLEPLQKETFLTQDEVGVAGGTHTHTIRLAQAGVAATREWKCIVYYWQVTLMN